MHGIDIVCENLVDAAFRGIVQAGAVAIEGGIELPITATRLNRQGPGATFVEEHFAVQMLPAVDALRVDWISPAGPRVPVQRMQLREQCQMRVEGRHVEQNIGWLVRAAAHPQGLVALDWGGSSWLGSVAWLVAHGWLAATGRSVPNALGGVWPQGRITDAGRAYLGGLADVQIYVDTHRATRLAFDGSSWWLDGGDRWLHQITPPAGLTLQPAECMALRDFPLAQLG